MFSFFIYMLTYKSLFSDFTSMAFFIVSILLVENGLNLGVVSGW